MYTVTIINIFRHIQILFEKYHSRLFKHSTLTNFKSNFQWFNLFFKFAQIKICNWYLHDYAIIYFLFNSIQKRTQFYPLNYRHFNKGIVLLDRIQAHDPTIDGSGKPGNDLIIFKKIGIKELSSNSSNVGAVLTLKASPNLIKVLKFNSIVNVTLHCGK